MAERPSGERKTILCIDDEEGMRKSMDRLLRSISYHVISAGTGEEGLVKAREERPDLIFLDVRMQAAGAKSSRIPPSFACLIRVPGTSARRCEEKGATVATTRATRGAWGYSRCWS